MGVHLPALGVEGGAQPAVVGGRHVQVAAVVGRPAVLVQVGLKERGGLGGVLDDPVEEDLDRAEAQSAYALEVRPQLLRVRDRRGRVLRQVGPDAQGGHDPLGQPPGFGEALIDLQLAAAHHGFHEGGDAGRGGLGEDLRGGVRELCRVGLGDVPGDERLGVVLEHAGGLAVRALDDLAADRVGGGRGDLRDVEGALTGPEVVPVAAAQGDGAPGRQGVEDGVVRGGAAGEQPDRVPVLHHQPAVGLLVGGVLQEPGQRLPQLLDGLLGARRGRAAASGSRRPSGGRARRGRRS